MCFFYVLCRFLLLGNCRASIRTKYRNDVDILLAIFSINLLSHENTTRYKRHNNYGYTSRAFYIFDKFFELKSRKVESIGQ